MTGLPPRHRLFVDAVLGHGAAVELSAAQAHYLRDVVRCAPGDALALFNGRDGEWQAGIVELSKKRGLARAERALRPQAPEPDLWLCFAPIKGHRLDTIVEKATELGCSAIQPVLTRRTVVGRVNLERLAANALEAAEQSERLSLPEVRAPMRLDALLAGWNPARLLIHCDERASAPPMLAALAGTAPGRPAAILTGPEGGFAPEEQAAIAASGASLAVSLGPRVLRADTAAIAALSLYQSALGDWRV